MDVSEGRPLEERIGLLVVGERSLFNGVSELAVRGIGEGSPGGCSPLSGSG